MLFMNLSKADQTAHQLATITVQLDELLWMLATATGNEVTRPDLIF